MMVLQHLCRNLLTVAAKQPVSHSKTKLQYCCRAMADFQPVLDFWFPPGKSTEERQKVWFAGTSADNGIRDKFGDLIIKARNGELKQWEDNEKSALAHIILIDQFCRSVYRCDYKIYHLYTRMKELISQICEAVLEGERVHRFFSDGVTQFAVSASEAVSLVRMSLKRITGWSVFTLFLDKINPPIQEFLAKDGNARYTLTLNFFGSPICRLLQKSVQGTADAFSHDHVALRIARQVIDSGKYKNLNAMERFFLYLTHQHAEDLDIQNKSILLHEELLKDYEGTEFEGLAKSGLSYAKLHREVIEKYGRFPKRNQAIGRENTPEEEELLKNYPYGF